MKIHVPADLYSFGSSVASCICLHLAVSWSTGLIQLIFTAILHHCHMNLSRPMSQRCKEESVHPFVISRTLFWHRINWRFKCNKVPYCDRSSPTVIDQSIDRIDGIVRRLLRKFRASVWMTTYMIQNPARSDSRHWFTSSIMHHTSSYYLFYGRLDRLYTYIHT
jgi:hypothetical protein